MCGSPDGWTPEKTRSLGGREVSSAESPACTPVVVVMARAVYRRYLATRLWRRPVTIRMVRMSDVLRQLRQQQTSTDARPRLIDRYAAFLPRYRRHAAHLTRRGLHAARPRAQPGPRDRRAAAPPQVRGHEPDRLVQGPRHGRGRGQGAGGRRDARSSAPRPATPPHRPPRTAPPPAWRCVVCCRRARSRPASCSRRRWPARGSSAVEGNFDEALQIVRDLVDDAEAADRPVTLVNSVNPYRIAGQKTAAFEVCEDLGGAPDYLRIPVGNAGNITAYWHGLHRLPRRGPGRDAAGDARLPGGRRRAARAAASPCRRPEDRGDRHPHRQSGQRRAGAARARRIGRRDRGRHRRRDPGRLPRPRATTRGSSASPPRRRRWPACASWPRRAASIRVRPSSAC